MAPVLRSQPLVIAKQSKPEIAKKYRIKLGKFNKIVKDLSIAALRKQQKTDYIEKLHLLKLKCTKSNKLKKAINDLKEKHKQECEDEIRLFTSKGKFRVECIVPLKPCSHEGPCGTGAKNCSCKINGFCYHACRCSATCEKRFPGCNCQPGKCGSNNCFCFLHRWECNPATCKSCNCGDPHAAGSCQNLALSKGNPKQCVPMESQIPGAGRGLFVMEDVKKGEFLLEYTGERLSSKEADRRGEVCDENGFSYIFGLSTGQAIDASLESDTARFANHKCERDSNAAAKVIVVKGVQRIGVFAKQDMAARTELFLNYNYTKEHKKRMMESVKKRLEAGHQ